MTADDIEAACHRIGKSKGNSKKTIVRLIYWKHCQLQMCLALVNRKKLKSLNSESIGLLSTYTLKTLYPIYELLVKGLSRPFIYVSHWNCNPNLDFETMMVIFLLALLVTPQFNQAIKVL